MIPITKPYFSEEEERAVIDTLRSGWVSQGPKVMEFEEGFSRYVGSPFAIATTSCTTALFLALKVAGVGKGDEVICPSLSFIATANSIMHAGALPRFVDIDPRTYNIDPSLIEKAVTGNTRAIMPVHQVGLACDMDEIQEIAKAHGLIIIEDSACAAGAEYKRKRIGSGENLACFSFHPRKTLVTGEGGMITTNNAGYAERLKSLRHHSMSLSALERHKSEELIFESYSELGYNFRMTDIQAAMGIVQLSKLDEMTERRRALAERYNKAFSEIDCLTAQFEPEYARHSYQSYILRLNKNSHMRRNELMKRLLEKDIATRRGIMSSHKESFYKELCGEVFLPATEDASDNTLIIPLYPGMREEEQDYVIEEIKNSLVI